MTSPQSAASSNATSIYEKFILSTESVAGSKSSTNSVSKYRGRDKVDTMDVSHYFFSIFYASEKGSLGIWEKQLGLGHIKRRVETDGSTRFHVLELVNTKNSQGTYIQAPRKEFTALHITLAHLVVVMKNFRRNFSFEVQVLDNKGFLRRFNMATWFSPSSLKKMPFICQLPLALEIGWNEIHVDLDYLLQRIYKTRYFETVRLIINANCRLRQVYFCSDGVIEGEIPVPSMKIFENVKLYPPTFGPLNHPNYLESGPTHLRDIPLPQPMMNPPSSRIEKDLRLIHFIRFSELNKFQLREPYKSFFEDVLTKSNKALYNVDSSMANIPQSSTTKNNNTIISKSTIEPESAIGLVDFDDSLIDIRSSGIIIPSDIRGHGPVTLTQLIQKAQSALLQDQLGTKSLDLPSIIESKSNDTHQQNENI